MRLRQRAYTPSAERVHVRRQLAAMAGGATLLVLLVGTAATWGQRTMASHERTLSDVALAQRLNVEGDGAHEALRGDVFAALLHDRHLLKFDDAAAIQDDADSHVADIVEGTRELSDIPLPGNLSAEASTLRAALQEYADLADRCVRQLLSGRTVVLSSLDAEYDVIDARQSTFTDHLAAAQRSALAGSKSARMVALIAVWTGVSLALLLLGGLFLAVRRSILAVTHRLEGLLETNETESARGEFGRSVVDALDMADDEDAARKVVSRAMLDVAPDMPIELLLADSSKAHLGRAAEHPTAGAPCCDVATPFACVAVRRGATVVFSDSEKLDACPKLKNREGGPLSAACVPITFMGRAIGVLHAGGPQGQEPDAEAVERLGRLAAHAGARIGTLRATQQTQMQAATDGLTGLANRRTLEDEVRTLLRTGRSFALAFADLDHFKSLNDTHGHEAGDRALRLFAKTLRASTRDGDLLARYGGEEFVIVFPDRNVEEGREALERLRLSLHDAVSTSDIPSFTASFGLTDSSAGATVDEIVRVADLALLTAKESGRDQVVIAGSAPADVG